MTTFTDIRLLRVLSVIARFGKGRSDYYSSFPSFIRRSASGEEKKRKKEEESFSLFLAPFVCTFVRGEQHYYEAL